MKVVIDDRELPLPVDFTYHEMSGMKLVSGLKNGVELYEALAADDPACAVAFAAVALKRVDPSLTWTGLMEELGGMRVGQITLDFTADGDVGDPPPVAGEPAVLSVNE